MSTVREHYNPIVTALTEMPQARGGRRSTGSPPGPASGFALAADYRVVADTAAFNTSFAGVALTADSGVSWTLPRLIGHGRAADLLLFPRNISAQEAYELGIANKVVPGRRSWPPRPRPSPARLAEGPTAAYAAIKESLAYGAGALARRDPGKEDELQARAGRVGGPPRSRSRRS